MEQINLIKINCLNCNLPILLCICEPKTNDISRSEIDQLIIDYLGEDFLELIEKQRSKK